MPKTFKELTTGDLERIRQQIVKVIDIASLLRPYFSNRIDYNADYFVLEYKKQKTPDPLADQNNPDCSVNIGKDLSCTITGFDPQHEQWIQMIVFDYLKSHSFDLR